MYSWKATDVKCYTMSAFNLIQTASLSVLLPPSMFMYVTLASVICFVLFELCENGVFLGNGAQVYDFFF